MIGVNSATGKELKGYDHLRQSIRDILKTPIGSRVMRRDYGSRIWDLVDAPINAETLAELHIATAEALDKWEPRILIESVAVTFDPLKVRISDGVVVLSYENVKKTSAEEIGANNDKSSFQGDFTAAIGGLLPSGLESDGYSNNNLSEYAAEMLESGYLRADIDADGDIDIEDWVNYLMGTINSTTSFSAEKLARYNAIVDVAFNRWKDGDATFNRYWRTSGGRATSAALIVDVAGTYLPDGKKINLEGLVV